MRKLTTLFLTLVVFTLACKSDNAEKTDQAQKSATPAQQQPVYPVLPKDLGLKLFHETNYLDFIFHNFPFSMSQSEKPSIQANISYISSEPVTEIPESCKPIARQFYQIEGEIVVEADVYFSEGCYFYVFYLDGKATYANKMTQNGIGFFGNIINQALKTSENLGG